MTTETLTLIGLVVTLVLGIINFISNMRRAKSLSEMEGSTSIETLNKAVMLANKRALEAEVKSAEVEARLEILEGQMHYRITFDFKAGLKPAISDLVVTHVPVNRNANASSTV